MDSKYMVQHGSIYWCIASRLRVGVPHLPAPDGWAPLRRSPLLRPFRLRVRVLAHHDRVHFPRVCHELHLLRQSVRADKDGEAVQCVKSWRPYYLFRLNKLSQEVWKKRQAIRTCIEFLGWFEKLIISRNTIRENYRNNPAGTGISFYIRWWTVKLEMKTIQWRKCCES